MAMDCHVFNQKSIRRPRSSHDSPNFAVATPPASPTLRQIMKPGGTEGGTAPFIAGLGLTLTALGLYLLFDSVHVVSGGTGLISQWLIGNSGGWESTSRGIIFVPLLLGVGLLFYDAKTRIGWGLMWVGLAVIIVEILSRLQFMFSMKTSHLLLILGMTAAGIGLMLRGLREDKIAERSKSDPP